MHIGSNHNNNHNHNTNYNNNDNNKYTHIQGTPVQGLPDHELICPHLALCSKCVQGILRAWILALFCAVVVCLIGKFMSRQISPQISPQKVHKHYPGVLLCSAAPGPRGAAAIPSRGVDCDDTTTNNNTNNNNNSNTSTSNISLSMYIYIYAYTYIYIYIYV